MQQLNNLIVMSGLKKIQILCIYLTETMCLCTCQLPSLFFVNKFKV